MIRKLFNNAFSNYANLIIALVIGFIMSPFLVHRLGDLFYGIWVLVMSMTGYFSLLDLGMNRAIVRYVSMYEATDKRSKLRQFYSTSLVLYSLLGGVTVVATLVIAFVLHLFVDLGEHMLIAKLVVVIVGVDFAFSFPFGLMYAVLIGRQQHTVANRINITNTILKNVASYAVISFYPELIAIALIHVLFNMLKYFRIYFEVRKQCGYLSFRKGDYNPSLVPEIFNYSIYSFIVSTSSRVINFTDEIVVAIFLKVSDVTYYSIAVNLVGYFEKLIWSGASVFVPYISQLDARGDQENVAEGFFRGSKYTILLSLYVFSGIYLLGGDFVGIWMGESYGETVRPVLTILALAKVIAIAQSMSVARFFGTSRHQMLGKLNALEAVSNLLLSLVLVRTHGMVGIALGTLIPCCLFSGILLPLITFRTYAISFRVYLRKSLAGPLAVLGLSVTVMFYLGHPVGSYTALLAQGALLTLVFVALSLVLVVDATERSYLFLHWRLKSEI